MVHACARGKVISCVRLSICLSVGTKNASSPDPDHFAKHLQTVQNVEKLPCLFQVTSMRFGRAHLKADVFSFLVTVQPQHKVIHTSPLLSIWSPWQQKVTIQIRIQTLAILVHCITEVWCTHDTSLWSTRHWSTRHTSLWRKLQILRSGRASFFMVSASYSSTWEQTHGRRFNT